MKAPGSGLPKKNRGSLPIVFFIYAITFVIMPPPMEHFYGKYRTMEVDPWKAVSAQISGTYKPENHSPASHEAKLAFRKIPSIIGKLSFSGNQRTQVIFLYCIQLLMGFVFTFLLFNWLLDLTSSKYYAAMVTTGFLLTHIGSSFTYDLSFFFDGFAFFFLGIAMFSRSTVLFGLALTAALWTDERAIISLFGVLLFKLIIFGLFSQLFSSRYSLTALVVLLFYAVVRYCLTMYTGMYTPLGEGTAVGISIWVKEINLMPLAWMLTFKLYWYYLIPLGIYLWGKSIGVALFTGVFLFSALLATGLVIDVMRSASYLFPFLLCGIYCTHQVWASDKNNWVARFNALWNLVIPNYRKLDVLHLILPIPGRLFRIFF